MPLWHHSSCCNLFPRVKFQGIPNKREKCSTCHGEFSDCPGHFGYLKLALPVFNVGFFNCILDVLKCICKVLPLRSLHHGCAEHLNSVFIIILVLSCLSRAVAEFFLRARSFCREWSAGTDPGRNVAVFYTANHHREAFRPEISLNERALRLYRV